ncbi:hypothetical protein [Methylobacterium sp. Leaf102]|uniref:hypothetical protein n=1 Tax=Methylobacterium sp. Leaf102 TaxID=1736253 RepID=UPI0012E906EC|nr:hypothetical protein [Methylobacterium sp. Leaf102]
MALGLRRATLQRVATAKLEDAVLLLAHQRFSNAHYLAGFAVEIGIKAVIAARFQAETIPDKNFVFDLYSHDIAKLIKLAGLSQELRSKEESDSSFAAQWAIVCEWKPDLRYDSSDAISSQLMINATQDVIEWIKKFW